MAQKRAIRLGKLLNCSSDTDNEMENDWKLLINCLRNKSGNEITQTYPSFFVCIIIFSIYVKKFYTIEENIKNCNLW